MDPSDSPSVSGARNDRVTLRFIASPQDANISGDFVAAGAILEWIDKAGYACAVGWSASYCVTAYVGNVHFTRSIRPGELIEVTAQLVHTGRTSMQVLVRASSTDIRHDDYRPAIHCLLVFVAVDDTGAPVPVPRWVPMGAQERELEQNAQARADVRRAIRDEMQRAIFSDAGSAPRVVFRFLALPQVANFGGNAHGGTVMRWMNEAAYALAAGWVSSATAATYTGGIHFHRPIRIGQIVEVDVRLLHTTDAAMHISVHVRAADTAQPGEWGLVTQCVMIFGVRGGKTASIRPLPLVTEEDHQLNRLARRLIEMRAGLPRVPDGPPA